MIIRPWHRRHDRRQQDAWPAPDHPFIRIWSLQHASDGPRESWAVELAGAGERRTIGRITLRDRAGEVARLGIYLSPAWTGQGYGRAALRLFLGECFTTIGLRMVRLDVAASNMRALKCYEEIGFQYQYSEWRIVGPDPALALLDEPEYAHLKGFFDADFFRPACCALFYELGLSAEDWYSYVAPDATRAVAC